MRVLGRGPLDMFRMEAQVDDVENLITRSPYRAASVLCFAHLENTQEPRKGRHCREWKMHAIGVSALAPMS